jgi:hypothetical protein
MKNLPWTNIGAVAAVLLSLVLIGAKNIDSAVRKAYTLLRSRTDGLAVGQERLGAEPAYYLV